MPSFFGRIVYHRGLNSQRLDRSASATRSFLTHCIRFPDACSRVAQISRGNLTGASTPAVASTVARNVVFTWQNNAGTGNAQATDTAILVTFFPTLNEAVYKVTTIARSAATATLTVPTKYSKVVAQCWIIFQTADGQLQANSNYIGTVTVF